MNRNALIATFSLQLALIGGGAALDAAGGGAPSNDPSTIEATAIRMARARLKQAMTRDFPFGEFFANVARAETSRDSFRATLG